MGKSDSRLNLISRLLQLRIGFNEVEHYAGDLNLKLKSEKSKKSPNNERKLVREAMLIKYRDEINFNKETKAEMTRMRRDIKMEFGENTRMARNILKQLRNEELGMRKEMGDKYDEKVEHLRRKYA